MVNILVLPLIAQLVSAAGAAAKKTEEEEEEQAHEHPTCIRDAYYENQQQGQWLQGSCPNINKETHRQSPVNLEFEKMTIKSPAQDTTFEKNGQKKNALEFIKELFAEPKPAHLQNTHCHGYKVGYYDEATLGDEWKNYSKACGCQKKENGIVGTDTEYRCYAVHGAYYAYDRLDENGNIDKVNGKLKNVFGYYCPYMRFHMNYGEHRVNGHQYFGEVQVVCHKDSFEDLQAAEKAADAIGSIKVFSFFIEQSPSVKDFGLFTRVIRDVTECVNASTAGCSGLYEGDNAVNNVAFDDIRFRGVEKLMESGWMRYEGSLTTYPCPENVDWFIAMTPLTISTAQYVNVLHWPIDVQMNNRAITSYHPKVDLFTDKTMEEAISYMTCSTAISVILALSSQFL